METRISVGATALTIWLGRQGENAARTIVFDCSAFAAEFPGGVPFLSVRRPREREQYSAALAIDGTDARWTVTAADTAISGIGECELTWKTGEIKRKSTVFRTNIVKSMSMPEKQPPEPERGWYDDIMDSAETIKSNIGRADSAAQGAEQSADAAKRAADSAGHSADAATSAATQAAESAVSAGNSADSARNSLQTLIDGIESGEFKGDTGEDGISPTVSIEPIDGGHRITITDRDGTHSADVLDGTSPTPDKTLSIDGAPADAAAVGAAESQLSESITEISNATIERVFSENVHNLDLDENAVLNTDGKSLIASQTQKTTAFIPVKTGDVVYLTARNASGAFWDIRSINFRWIAFYTEEKLDSCIGIYAYQNGYAVPEGAKYMRCTYVVGTSSLFEITLNWYPTRVEQQSEYYLPYTTAKHDVNMYMVDCWGDSRTDMSTGTSFTDYLNTLLGDKFIVSNYGISSQSSGTVAMRLGALDVFVSLNGNKIPQSGEVLLNGLKVSSDYPLSVFSFSNTAYSNMILNGINGRFVRASTSDYSNCKFERFSDGIEQTVRPKTKLIPYNHESKNHICVFWFGKNDFAKYSGTPVNQVIDNYKRCVDKIGHDKFVILGETCSIQGLCLTAEPDCVGVPTIGWGHTGTVDGVKIKKGMKITRAKAEELLAADMAATWEKVLDPDWLHLTNEMNDDQQGALCSLAFNCGTNTLKTISKVVENGQFKRWRTLKEVGDAIPLYNKAGGKYVQGLMDRRMDEKALFFGTNKKQGKTVDMYTVKNGDRGQQVKVLQCRLNDALSADLSTDGIFGTQTENAVRKLQKLHGLTVDGVCGTKTWAVIL